MREVQQRRPPCRDLLPRQGLPDAASREAITGRTTTWADGAPCWLHLSVPDLERACAFYEPEGRRFYGAVFAYSYRTIPQVPIGEYAIFGPDDRPWGGMGGLVGVPSGVPSHWLPYFSVANVDAAVARAGLSRGGVRRSPEDTPFGRIAVLADPFGAPFGLVSAA